jgi:hypothetical protein
MNRICSNERPYFSTYQAFYIMTNTVPINVGDFRHADGHWLSSNATFDIINLLDSRCTLCQRCNTIDGISWNGNYSITTKNVRCKSDQ